eukprot:3167048-Amphidinium_carterae.1
MRREYWLAITALRKTDIDVNVAHYRSTMLSAWPTSATFLEALAQCGLGAAWDESLSCKSQ